MKLKPMPEGFVPHHPLARCWQCPLYELDSYVPPTLGSGELAVVGEAPGATEEAQGRNLAGPSGRVFAHAIVAAGDAAPFRGMTVTNAVACRPVNNATPSATAIECCAPKLAADLEPVAEVLALGGVAAKAITGRKGMKLRNVTGTVDTDRWQGRPVAIAPHPAAVLRFATWWPDLVEGVSRVHAQVLYEPPKPAQVVRGRIELAQALHWMDQSRPFVVDVEATRAPAWHRTDPERLRCVGFAQDETAVVVPEELVPEVAGMLSTAFQLQGIIAQHLQYELPVLRKFGIAARAAGDTMLTAQTRDERPGGKGLEALSRRRLGSPYWKPEGENDDDAGRWYDEVGAEELYAYNGVDLVHTSRLWSQDCEELSERDWRLHNDTLLPAAVMLADATAKGIGVDQVEVERLLVIHEAAEAAAIARLGDLNPRSPKQVREAFAELGYDLSSTTADTLAGLDDATPPALELVEAILAARGDRKLLGTYLRPLLTLDSRDGRVHTSLNIAGAETGRLSSSVPNMQNQPPEVRSVFVAQPGNTFIQADYKQAELRVVAVLVYETTGDETLLDLVRSGRDLMSELAADVFGPDWTKGQRRQAKAVVHGTNYGRGVAGIAKGERIPMEVAERVHRTYLRTYPGLGQWHRAIKRDVALGVEQVTPYGRVRRLPRRMAWMDSEVIAGMGREAMANMPQSIASDINLHAGIELHRWGFTPSLLVHDNNLLEVEDSAVAAAREALQEATYTAGRTFTDLVDFPVEVTQGTRWSEL